jgi:hypothetical protein
MVRKYRWKGTRWELAKTASPSANQASRGSGTVPAIRQQHGATRMVVVVVVICSTGRIEELRPGSNSRPESQLRPAGCFGAGGKWEWERERAGQGRQRPHRLPNG